MDLKLNYKVDGYHQNSFATILSVGIFLSDRQLYELLLIGTMMTIQFHFDFSVSTVENVWYIQQ